MVPFRQLDRVFAVRKGTSVLLWHIADDALIVSKVRY
jgi:hypothetical protein